MFTPISTERLLLRPARVSDTTALFERRADPVVSELQDWPMPYSLERAETQIERSMASDDPVVDSGWMLTIADPTDSIIYGDINIFLEDDGRTSGVGYSITPAYWARCSCGPRPTRVANNRSSLGTAIRIARSPFLQTYEFLEREK